MIYTSELTYHVMLSSSTWNTVGMAHIYVISFIQSRTSCYVVHLFEVLPTGVTLGDVWGSRLVTLSRICTQLYITEGENVSAATYLHFRLSRGQKSVPFWWNFGPKSTFFMVWHPSMVVNMCLWPDMSHYWGLIERIPNRAIFAKFRSKNDQIAISRPFQKTAGQIFYIMFSGPSPIRWRVEQGN